MSDLRTTEATNEAIQHVLSNLWDRGEAELAHLGLTHAAAAAFILQRRDDGAPTFALWSGEEPLFVAGLVNSENCAGLRGMNTWFQATHRFHVHYREITRALRAGLEAEASRYELDFVEIFSSCPHEKTGRWFRALGFELDVDYHYILKTGVRMYRFVRDFGRERHVLQ